jgi:Rps23 Pro-64 3,4-dihydroxylase Tpa1-like proline 4-hydroxylase
VSIVGQESHPISPPWRPDTDGFVDQTVSAAAEAIRSRFETAEPFKHAVVENFFHPALAEVLLGDFPTFDPERAKNEFGQIGAKAVNEHIETISEAYRHLAAYIQSPEFLSLVGRLTGISDLLPDPNLYGGGTHENRHGQALDPHIDFNYDPNTKLHRRLNLLVYLNREWREAWGGSIELHSNPRRPDTNQITSFTPEFNRAVVFETNERSWHGFPRIVLPEDKRHLSRKSLSIYLYTRTRPAHEIVAEHGTFYVQRPLPTRFHPGLALTRADIDEITSLLGQRDDWIQHYQMTEIRTSAESGALRERIASLEAELAGRRARRRKSLGKWLGLPFNKKR